MVDAARVWATSTARVCATRTARVGAARPALGEIEQAGCQVHRPRRAANLVVDHADLVALLPEGEHGVDEVAPARPEQP